MTRASSEEGDRSRRLILLAAVSGIALSGILVVATSRAAFSAQTSNTGNSLAAGDVTLTDDDADVAMFSVTNMAPNDAAVQACIEVTYEGSIADPGEVRLYSGGFDDTGTLGSQLDLTIEVGTGGDFSTCAGFTPSSTIFTTDKLATFDSTYSDYPGGLSTWDPAATPESRTFRFTIDLPSDADSAVQGDAVSNLAFVWEVQS